MNETNFSPMRLHRFLEASAVRHPEKTAVIHDDERIGYGTLNRMADALAGCLERNGIASGDRVALLLENSIEFIVAYHAVLKAGAVATPLDPALKPEGLRCLMDDLEPSAVITSSKSERSLEAVRLNPETLKLLVVANPNDRWSNRPFTVLTFAETTRPENATAFRTARTPGSSPATILYTSGSCGQPKGVLLSHDNIVSNTRAICRFLRLTSGDIQMVVLPFFYVMGLSLLNTHMAAGGTLVLNNRFMYPADVVRQMIEEKVTGFSGVPSTYAYLLNRSPLAACRERLTNLRYCSQAGGHMARALKLALRKALPDHTKLFIMYGATEASARLTYLDPADFDSKIDSIGKPIPGVTIRILDENGRDVPDGGHGEFVASGPGIMQGYWKDPGYTASVLDHEGFHTGDIGRRDKDGFLYLLGRKDDLLKVGGHRINPLEIEEFLSATDLIVETAVIGLPDPLLGTRLVALVVPRSGCCEAGTLLEKCANGLPGHKRPRGIIVARALPKNSSGKIDRDRCARIAATHK